MKLLSSLMLVAAAAQGAQAFVPVLPRSAGSSSSSSSSSSARAVLARRSSVRLPTPPELLQEPQLQPSEEQHQQLQQLQAAAVAAPMGAPGDARPNKKRKGPTPVVVVDDDSLETTNEHRLLVGTHYLLTLVALVQVASAYGGGASLVEAAALAATAAFSLVFSDFFSGVFHWSVDNYGDGSTPLLGGVIAAFQGHHDAPWTITHRGFANNVHKITKITIPAMLALVTLGHVGEHPLLGLFGTLFFNLQVLSQEFHKLSHLSKPPRWAVALQSVGLAISRKEHGQHHSSPFQSNYCILTGTCNKWLDESGFYRRLERVVFDVTGAVPNCWTFGPEGEEVRALALTRGGASAQGQEQEQEQR